MIMTNLDSENKIKNADQQQESSKYQLETAGCAFPEPQIQMGVARSWGVILFMRSDPAHGE